MKTGALGAPRLKRLFRLDALLHAAAVLAIAWGLASRAAVLAPMSGALPVTDADAHYYYHGALNLVQAGVYAVEPPGNGAPRRPTAVRGVLYPAVLAAAMLVPGLRRPELLWDVNAAAALAVLALVYLIGLRLRSSLCGALAAAAVALDPRHTLAVGILDVEVFYGLLVLAVFLALLYWSDKPSPARSAAAGFAVGVSLLCRSTLIIFPALWACLLWLDRKNLERPGRQLALFVLFTILPVLPWAARNAYCFGRWSVMEVGPAGWVMRLGAAGFIENDKTGPRAGGDDPQLFDELRRRSPDAGRDFRDSLRTVREEPLRYLRACARRWLDLWGLWAVVLALAMAPLFGRRRGLTDTALAALPLYWSIHALLLSTGRYLVPLIPVLAVVAALRLVDPLRKGGGPRLYRLRPLSAAALGLTLVFFSAACAALAAERLALSRGGPRPGTAALLIERARRDDARGERDAARSELDLSLAASPRAYQLADIARVDQALGNYSRCRDLFGRVAAEFPRDAKAFSDEGVCAFQAGDSRGARLALEKAVSLDPADPQAAASLAFLIQNAGKR